MGASCSIFTDRSLVSVVPQPSVRGGSSRHVITNIHNQHHCNSWLQQRSPIVAFGDEDVPSIATTRTSTPSSPRNNQKKVKEGISVFFHHEEDEKEKGDFIKQFYGEHSRVSSMSSPYASSIHEETPFSDGPASKNPTLLPHAVQEGPGEDLEHVPTAIGKLAHKLAQTFSSNSIIFVPPDEECDSEEDKYGGQFHTDNNAPLLNNNDLLDYVFSFLPPGFVIYQIRAVCTRWREVVRRTKHLAEIHPATTWKRSFIEGRLSRLYFVHMEQFIEKEFDQEEARLRFRLTGTTDHVNQDLRYFSRLKCIRKLDLSLCAMNNTGMAFLQNMTCLEELCVRDHYHLNDDAFRILPYLRRLRVLDLDGCISVGNQTLQHLQYLKRLRVLNIRKCNSKINNVGLGYTSCLSRLRSLNISGLPEITATALEHLPANLQSLSIATCRGIMSSLALAGENASALLSLMRFTDTLRDLDISANTSSPSMSIVVQFCSCFHHLRSLNLSFLRKIRDTEVRAAVASSASTLQQLYLSGCDSLTDEVLFMVASDLPQLQLLSMRQCDQITDRGLAYLENHASLREFDLTYNSKITDAGLAYLPRHSLCALNISDCAEIGDAGLAEHVSRMVHLRVLNLDGLKRMTDACLEPLLTPLLDLRKLIVTGCSGLTRSGRQMVEDRIFGSTTRSRFEIVCDHNFTAEKQQPHRSRTKPV